MSEHAPDRTEIETVLGLPRSFWFLLTFAILMTIGWAVASIMVVVNDI